MDTIWLKLRKDELGFFFDIDKLRSKLYRHENHSDNEIGFLGALRNIKVWVNKDEIVIKGSLAKYFYKTNAKNFDWRQIKTAIKFLSDDLGLPLEKAKISRLDIGVNIIVNNNVTDYFPELFHLYNYQRITEYETTLRFKRNKKQINYQFYDKIKQIKRKRIPDVDDDHAIRNITNLMRIELQIQEEVNDFLKIDDVRVSDLSKPEFCKQLMRKWFDLYKGIQKRAVLTTSNSMKSIRDIDKFIIKKYIEENGWDDLNYMLKKAVEKKIIKAPAKSKKLKQLRTIMLNNSIFILQEHTLELNHKIKVEYVEALKQIFKMK